MALILSIETCNAACGAVVSRVDVGTGAGKLKIQDDAGVLLCEITLASPAFYEAQDGVAHAAELPKSGTGTRHAGEGTRAARFDVTDSEDNVAWSGTIPENMTLDNESIAKNQVVSVVSWSHAQPAS